MRLSSVIQYTLVGLIFSKYAWADNISKELEAKLLKNKPKSNSASLNIKNSKVQESEQDLLKSLKRYEIVLAKETKPENIFAIELNRTVCYLQLARVNRIKSGGKKLDSIEESYLRKATTTIEKLLNYENLNNEVKSQLKYFQGIALLDLSMKEISRKAFEDSIELNSNASYVPSLSLYLADLLYDENDLEKAKFAYKRFYERLSTDERNLADYKIAWINLNQSKIDEALEIFIKLIQDSRSSSIVQDSSLSLAVAWADKYQEDEILQKISELKVSEEKKIKILQSVYDNFLKSPNRTHRKIWERILKFEIKEEGITKLLSNEMELLSFKEKVDSDRDFLETLIKYINENFETIKNYQKINLKALGQDLENLISKLTNLYQNQKNPKNLAALISSLELYLKFNGFDHQVDIASVYLDLLSEHKENEKLVSFCYEVIKNPKLKSLKNKAKLIILMDLEAKYLENPGQYQTKFFNLVRVYLEDAKADQWQAVAIKFYSYLIKAKNFDEAEAYMNLINKVFPSDDSFIKLISVKYEQKKCSEIIDILNKREKIKPELIDYKRECYLSLATEAKKDLKNFPEYKKYIFEFIKLADEQKKDLADTDYLLTVARVVKSKDPEIAKYVSFSEYEDLLNNKYYPLRFKEEFFPLYQYKIDQFIEQGNYAELNKILEGCDKVKICASNLNFLQKVNSFKKIDDEVLADQFINVKLDNDNLPYVSLLNPEIIIDKTLKGEIQFDKKYLLVAAKLVGVDLQDEQNKFLYDKIESLLSKEELKYTNLNSLKQLSNIKLPEFKTRHKLKDTEVLAMMNKVQKTRPTILADLTNVSVNVQKQILQKAIDVENKMVQIITLSPIPKNLDASKKSEYEEGLKQLSEEFVKQAEAYNQALIKVEEQIDNLNKEKEAINNLKIPANKLDWNIIEKIPENEYLDKYITEKKMYSAFFYLDYLNSLNKVSPTEYFYWRSLILFTSASNRTKASFMINYIFNEFTANKLDTLILGWKNGSKK